jgi:sigma-B regulation protein RsbU (phosphoserine phosphatase)
VVKGEQEALLLCRAILYGVERKRIKARLEQVVGELRQRNAQMAADLNMAREVQLALLPRGYPPFPPTARPADSRLRFAHFYLPCRTVGGDFFSIIPVSDQAAGVFICDVMGHGMRSALVTAIIRGLLEELRSVAHEPGRLLTKANRAFSAVLRQPHQALFASALYVLVDPEHGTLTGANAGHPAPLRLPAEGGTAEMLAFTGRSFGPALGIDGEAGYETCGWTLAPGDRLLLYTDGLTELTDAQAQEYGESRLLAAARRHAGNPLAALVDAIILDAGAFCAEEEPADDICLVGVQTAGAP